MLTAGSPVTDFPGYRESLPVTDRSAAPTIPVLTAGSPVTEFTGYRENFLITQICCSHHPSADSRLPSYREICCSHHSSADSRLTGYRGYWLQRIYRLTEVIGYREICCPHHSSADSRLTGYREISCSHGQKAT